MITETKMFVWFLLLGSVLSTPTDEFREFTNKGIQDFLKKSEKVNIVPGFISVDQRSRPIERPSSFTDKKKWTELMKINSNNKYFKLFNSHIEKSNTLKGLTFCIYDDNMREAAIALFRLFQTTDGENFENVKDWASENINKDMFMYALRLESLYSAKTKETTLYPPFIWNPNYFVNTETIIKAAIIGNELTKNGMIDEDMGKVDHYHYGSHVTNRYVVIQTNYSGWNLPRGNNNDGLNYFREDVALNSYYLGIHLLHPFWMTTEELEFNNPRFAEHYYYAHQQLLARYNLEKQHLKIDSTSFSTDGWDYVPYLSYKNGLPFPTRSCLRGDWDNEKAYLKSIDIAIRECISRGLIIMQNGTTLAMTDDSHINILAKLIRANLDGIKVAKIARSIIGYGGNTYPINEYNPAPSLLHHPETAMRDPAYWTMLQYMLNYFSDYKNTMEPFDLSQYEADGFEIVDHEFSELKTFMDNYIFPINSAITNSPDDERSPILSIKQRRLNQYFFSLNFTIESAVNMDTIVRLYLGPACSNKNCWDQYEKFFELDTFSFTLMEGMNIVPWSSLTSERLSFSGAYNSPALREASPKYSIFRFPDNLLLPKGLKEGLNLTLFIMITPTDDDTIPYPESFYRENSNELDSKPLGFPFHRQAKNCNDAALNYKFFNVTIFHDN